MLILDRKRDQKIMIGDGIVLTVVEIRYDSVRIGIDADISIPVHREEVAEKIAKGRPGKAGADSGDNQGL